MKHLTKEQRYRIKAYLGHKTNINIYSKRNQCFGIILKLNFLAVSITSQNPNLTHGSVFQQTLILSLNIKLYFCQKTFGYVCFG